MDYEKELQEIGFTGNSEILQIINDENGEIIKTPYTVNKLVKELKDYEEALQKAEKRKKEFLDLNEIQGDINKNGKIEKWKDYPKSLFEKFTKEYTTRQYKDIHSIKISNFVGRVKVNNIIQEQKNQDGKIGYLQVKNYPGLGMVWNLTADTWFEEDPTQPEKLGRWHVHHITNNGYDNSLENLILIRQSLHYKIHSLAKKLQK